MRKLVLQMQLSLDGCASGPNGELDWIFPGFDDDYAAWSSEKLWDASAHLMGGPTYTAMAAHWPASTEPYAPPMNQIPKIVFSRTLTETTWGETRILAGDLGEEIRRLKRDSGRPLLAHGGVGFARALIQTGLIDEYRLVSHPVMVGDGRRPFNELAAPLRFTPLETKTFKTGVVARLLKPA